MLCNCKVCFLVFKAYHMYHTPHPNPSLFFLLKKLSGGGWMVWNGMVMVMGDGRWVGGWLGVVVVVVVVG